MHLNTQSRNEDDVLLINIHVYHVQNTDQEIPDRLLVTAVPLFMI